ncbi:hypothetical protein D3C78_1393820 [compost metagenome]
MYSSRGVTWRAGNSLAAAPTAGGAASTAGTTAATAPSALTSTRAPARSRVWRYFSALSPSRLLLITIRRPENSAAMRCGSAWNKRARFASTCAASAPGTSSPAKTTS